MQTRLTEDLFRGSLAFLGAFFGLPMGLVLLFVGFVLLPGVQPPVSIVWVTVAYCAAFRVICFVARLANANNHSTRLASRSSSRKTSAATTRDLFRGSLAVCPNMAGAATRATMQGWRA